MNTKSTFLWNEAAVSPELGFPDDLDGLVHPGVLAHQPHSRPCEGPVDLVRTCFPRRHM